MWFDTSTLVGKHLTVRGFFVGDFDYRDKVVPVIRERRRWWPTAPSLSVASMYPLNVLPDAVQPPLRGGKISC